jgi:hypothetical protein
MMNSIRIERAQNGFVVCMDDPAIIAKNQKSDGPYRSPERQFVFDDEAGVIAFITKNLDKIIPEKDEYATSFDTAAKESDEEEADEEDEEEDEDK